jgi:cytokinin riboside 5'-monophosphate phosphoribohydrolase
MPLQRVCVFCGASPGYGAAYMKAAKKLGEEIASRNMTLVYGGKGLALWLC